MVLSALAKVPVKNDCACVEVKLATLRICTRINPLLRLALGDEPSCDDGDHCDPDVRGEEIGFTVEHDVEPPVAAQPGEQPLHPLRSHSTRSRARNLWLLRPPDPARQEASVPCPARRDRDVDV